MNLPHSHRNVALSILAVYLITSVHHVYGAWLYETPWRNHIAYQGFTWLMISYVILLISHKWNYQLIKWIFIAFAGFFFVGAIGFYEGLYNHILKNIMHFAGVNHELMVKLYPPPKYELPNDFLFEFSGIATFVICMWCLRTMINFLKADPSR